MLGFTHWHLIRWKLILHCHSCSVIIQPPIFLPRSLSSMKPLWFLTHPKTKPSSLMNLQPCSGLTLSCRMTSQKTEVSCQTKKDTQVSLYLTWYPYTINIKWEKTLATCLTCRHQHGNHNYDCSGRECGGGYGHCTHLLQVSSRGV